MIQRIQTIWLLLASVAVFITLKLSFYSGTLISNNLFHSLTATDTDQFLLMVLTCSLGTAIFITIFLFRNRKLQFRFCIAEMLVEGLLLFLYYKQTKLYSNGSLDIWAIFHLIVFIALIAAARAIAKDQKLLRESNRLR